MTQANETDFKEAPGGSKIRAAVVDGSLRIDVKTAAGVVKGVDMPLPVSVPTLVAACNVLMSNLAGVGKSSLEIAGWEALERADCVPD